MKPDQLRIRAARVRAVHDSYLVEHRKPHAGGWLIPSQEEVYQVVSSRTGESVNAVRHAMTYSRSCKHKWDEGACMDCPDASHIPW